MLTEGKFYDEYRKAAYKGLVMSIKDHVAPENSEEISFRKGTYLLIRQTDQNSQRVKALHEDGVSEGKLKNNIFFEPIREKKKKRMVANGMHRVSIEQKKVFYVCW